MEMKRNRLEIDDKNIVSRRDYQEILLARMARGDLYANELRLKIRRIDIALDKFRDKPLYPDEHKKKDDNG
jgi:hypothetical protein